VLGDSPIHPVLLSKDLSETRSFYHDKLGLEILSESEEEVTFRCGGGSRLAVTKSTTGTADSQTQAGWEVPDLRAEVEDVRARGVKIEEYDMPGLKTEDGIADIGFAWMAWIVDPGGNALAIMEIKSNGILNHRFWSPDSEDHSRWFGDLGARRGPSRQC
jgi:catechol 2,3-dioxygenase-like lactoylglutathione lyase family enzyme